MYILQGSGVAAGGNGIDNGKNMQYIKSITKRYGAKGEQYYKFRETTVLYAERHGSKAIHPIKLSYSKTITHVKPQKKTGKAGNQSTGQVSK